MASSSSVSAVSAKSPVNYVKPKAGTFIKRSFIAWRGASLLDGKPVVCVVTFDSGNAKTGDMAQAWILADNGETPHANNKSGADFSVCGDCKHRGGSCYVTLIHGPRAVYASVLAGRYEPLEAFPAEQAKRLKGYNLRIGAYGDPAAVPVDVWTNLAAAAEGRTGYTHQWNKPQFAGLSSLVMASVDTPEEQAQAQALGFRTFRIRLPEEALIKGEIVCPAAKESTGKFKLSCDQCRACAGKDTAGRRGNVAIIVHGGEGAKIRREGEAVGAGTMGTMEKNFRIIRLAIGGAR